jgi:hypothetical protein
LVLLAMSQAGPVAAALAATRPDLVRRPATWPRCRETRPGIRDLDHIAGTITAFLSGPP